MRRIVFLAILILSSAFGARAQTPNTISTVAGGGTNTGAATSAFIPGPAGVVHDSLGNTYVSASALSTVYKITSGGTISAFAGNGIAGFSGDGGTAANAELDDPQGLALDSNNHLFIADSNNNRIRWVDGSGNIHTYAGSGNQYNGVGFFGGFTGDHGPATSALMNFPVALAFDVNGNLFIADSINNRIRMVDNSPEHIITTYAGGATAVCAGATDTLGDGCAATQAFLGSPQGVAVHSSGDLYIADSGDSLIRKVDNTANHTITLYGGNINGTICPTSTDAVGDGCPATQATLNFPIGVFVDSAENILIGDTNDARIRKIDHTTQIITTIAGNGTICTNLTAAPVNCGDGGPATSALLNQPSVSFLDSLGNLLIVDFGTNRIRTVSGGAAPTITTFAGSGTGGDGGAATSAVVSAPFTLATDPSGNVFFTESNGNRIRRWDASAKTVTTYVGNGIQGVTGQPNGDNGLAIQANVVDPLGIVLDASGNLFFADGFAHVVRTVDHSTKIITTYAGTGRGCPAGAICGGDGGPATSATFRRPFGAALDSHGNLYISDSRDRRIRRVNAGTKIITNYAGTGAVGYTGDGGPAASATFNAPQGLAFDASDNLYVADALNNVIRKIDGTTQIITTYAFNGQPTFGGDGGAALAASMQVPEQVGLDSQSNLYVGGGFDNVVRRIDVNDQTVITVAGDVHNLDGGFRASDDGGPSTQALLSNFGVAVDANKNMYIADAGNARIRKVSLGPVAVVTSQLQPFGPVLPGAIGNTGFVTITNNGLDDLTVTSASVPAGFALSNSCLNPATQLPLPVSPTVGLCLLGATFTPPVGAANGTVFSGNLSFNTNDSAHSTFNFAITGTAITQPEPLTVILAGAGTGTVFGNQEGLVNGVPTPTVCTNATSPCTSNFALGEQVILSAVGTGGSAFTGWNVNGSATTCPGVAACTLTLSAAQNVTATFGSATLAVSGLGNGSGTITSSPAGINCTVTNGVASGPTCTFSAFPSGTQSVTLTATAAAGGSKFAGWLGLCGLLGSNGLNSAGTGPCTIPLTIAGITALNGAQATAVFSGPAKQFGQGDVFVGTVDGMIFEFTPAGALVQVLSSGNLGGTIGEMNFDAGGNLYAANPAATNTGTNPGTVEFFGNNGTGPTFDFGLYDSAPAGLLVAPNGNVFVGQSAGQNTLLEFTSAVNGNPPVNTFFPAFENGGVFYLELLDDGASMLYSSNSPAVKNFDILNNHQNPDFATNLPGGTAYAIRELPDKSVLVANTTAIQHLSSTGSTILNTYKPGGPGLFFALNLNPDGQSFWTGDALTGKVYQVKVSDGSVIGTPINTGLGFNAATFNFATIFGIAVFGQPPSGGADVLVSMSAPAADAVGSPITYTATVMNNGPLAAANVVAADAFPANVTVNSASSTVGSCSHTAGSATCTIGTMNSGASATVTIGATPTLAQTLSNTINVTSTTPDPVPGNNSFTTSTTVAGPSLAAISMFAPSFVQLGTGLTYEIQVSNPGVTTLSGIAVTDTLPGSMNATSLSPGCTGTNAITCTIGTLTPGQVVTVDIAIVPTTSPATLSNTANVTGGNSATVSTNVITNGMLLVIEDGSTNAADFVTSAPAGVNCTIVQFFCSNYFLPGTTVVLTANGPGFVGWSVDNTGATTCPGTGTCTVMMNSQHDVVASYNSPVVWFNSILQGGVVGVPYGADLSQSVIGGQQPFTFSKTGNLPNGLTLANNVISGVPTTPGTTSFSLSVTDATNTTVSINTSITIINPPNVTAQAAMVNGPYGVLFRGVSDADGSLRDFVGSLNFNGTGGLAGTIDTNGNGSSPAAQMISVTGTYTVGADNRGLMTLNIPGAKFGTFAFSVGDVHNGIVYSGRFVRFDDDTGTGTRGAGIFRRQMPSSFTPASFAGTYTFNGTGEDPQLARAIELGLFTVNNSGGFGSGSGDENDNGTLATISSITGSYSLPISSTTGRTMWSLVINGSGAATAVSYIIDANNVVFMTVDPGATSLVLAGTVERQDNPGTFSNGSLVGPDVLNAQGPSSATAQSSVYLAIATTSNVGGVPTVNLNFDSNEGGNVVVEGTQSAPYAIASNGRGTFNFTGNNKPVILYMVRQDHGVAMGTDATGSFGEIDLQHGGPFSNATFAGNFFIGDREPASPSGGSVISGVTTNSGNTLSFTVDESHARGSLNYANAGTFGISVASTGRVTFTSDPSKPLASSNEIGYQVSPSRAFVGDVDPTSQHPQVIEAESFTMPPGVVSPATITAAFGTTTVGNPLTQTFNVLNVGDGLLTILSVTNATDFRATGPCVTPLPNILVIAHGSCPLTINFDPSASSPTGVLLNEMLTLHTDAGDVTINASGTIAAGPATHFLVSAPGTATAGTAFNVTVTAQDASNNTATGYTSIVHFTSTDGAAVLPANSTLTNGVGNFSATLRTAGPETITATDTVTASITGTSATITVSAQQFAMTVTDAGTGTGTVTSQAGLSPAINCSTGSQTGCSALYNSGQNVTLTASGTNGSTFSGWSGGTPACSGTATCTVTMTQAQNVTATFAAAIQQFPLTVADAGTGTGTVTSQAGLSPAINCTTGSQTGCMASYNSGQNVTLTAAPASGSTFTGWSGGTPACSGTGTCSVTMTQTQNVTATFNPSTGPTLTSITVTPNPDIVNVGGTNQLTAIGTFSDGSQQDLTATAKWTSLTPTIATVSTAGLLTGVKAGGPVTIQAAMSGIVGSTSATVTATFAGPYQLGQVFASFANGLIGVFDSKGILLGTINTGQTLNAGLAFDATGNLYATTFSTPTGVVKLDTNGKVVGPFGSGYTGNPESIGFSHAGNALVGAAQTPGTTTLVPILEFAANGNPVATFQVAPENRGSDWVDLLSDQKTVLYTSEGTSVKSFDISKNVQNPDLATNLPGASAYALRQLTDGTVLVADSTAAVRLSMTGAIVQTYSPNPATQNLFALNLDPDGTSFWTADLTTGAIFRFDISSGNQLLNFTAPSNFVSGLAIFGEKAPGSNNITVTGNGSGAGTVTSNPTGLNCGVGGAAGSVCTAPFTDNTNVTLTAVPRAGSTFGGFSDNCNPPNPQTNPPTCLVGVGTADVAVTVTFNINGPALSIAKTHVGNFTQGQKNAQYTVTVSNATGAGPTNGTVTVTDTIPSGLTLVSMNGTGWSCGPAQNPSNVCTRTDALVAGASYPAITVTVNVMSSATSPQVNSVMVSGGGSASATANDSTTIVALTLVSIAVTPTNPTVVVGQTQQFTATGTFSDNSTQNLTASVVWASSNTDAASITAGGLATGLTGGDTSTISATFQQGDTNVTGSTLLTVTTVPFILTITPPAGGNPGAPITVSPGGQLAIGLTLTATPGFSGTVTFSCISNAPQFLTCSPAPASVTLSGNNPKQVAIVMNAFCADVPLIYGPGPGGLGGGLALLLVAGMLGSITWAYRRRSRWALSFAVLMLIALGNAACGGVPAGPSGRTPAGNYTLFITATAGGASQTVPVPIQVTN
ncbi:MAG: InlB B-repeat-containing protein [Candidatus Acidiferrales bacterium]